MAEHGSGQRRKLIEVALPLGVINAAAAREKSIRLGHPSTFHLWWARRPLAVCRAVLFAQLVDDPSSWPDLFPTAAAQDRERQRLFGVIADLVEWERCNQQETIDAARLEIARSLARARRALGIAERLDAAVLSDRVRPDVVDEHLAAIGPIVHDPFTGGGSIPLEAQRLGLRTAASDLNPVAVLLNKALVELPPRYAGRPPYHPDASSEASPRTWRGAQGLAQDVSYYARWLCDEVFQEVGHLHPPVRVTAELAAERPDLQSYTGRDLTVIAWLWVRTVASPEPTCRRAAVPLLPTYWIARRPGREHWLEPSVDRASNTWALTIKRGSPADPKLVAAGTKLGRGGRFRCILSGTPIPPSYLRAEGRAGRLGARLIAVVAEGDRRRLYLPASDEHDRIAAAVRPGWTPDHDLVKSSRYATPWIYGLDSFSDLFTPRQLVVLDAFASRVPAVRARIEADLASAEPALSEHERADHITAVTTCLALAVSRLVNRSSTLCFWHTTGEKVEQVFARQALSMTWDFAETNPFSHSTGSFLGQLRYLTAALERAPARAPASEVVRRDAADDVGERVLVCTDPPYYDNVPYADLADFFYIWLRRMLRHVHPGLFGTMLAPKEQELVVDARRRAAGGAAEAFFIDGMRRVLRRLARESRDDLPLTIFYAFRQSARRGERVFSTGWDAFLQALVESGLRVVSTWPVRTELPGNLKKRKNALASSIVLVCRRRSPDAPSLTRAEFRRRLRRDLPRALVQLRGGHIAPVDLAQAAIGPGMAIFSACARVVEADGSAMSVRTALQLINQVLDEHGNERASDLDPETRFAVAWFEAHGLEPGAFDEAETLTRARNLSLARVVEAGIVHAAAGQVRLLARRELPDARSTGPNLRLPLWCATQHLGKQLEECGEDTAATLLAGLAPDQAGAVRDLAYLLHAISERRGWADEARSYNALVRAWPALVRLAAARRPHGARRHDSSSRPR